MRQLLVIWLLSPIIFINANGQIIRPFTKGTLNMGGNISFQSDKLKDIHPSVDYIQRIKSLDLSFSSGYFLIDQLSAGIKVNYLITETKYKELSIPKNFTVQNLLIGPEIKYFLRTGIFCEASALYGFSSSGSTEGDHRQK